MTEIDKNRINIMTSCDDNLTDYLFVQIRTMAMHLANKKIHFFLLHHRIPNEKLEKLKVYCQYFSNIIFKAIFVEEVEHFIELSKNGLKEVNEQGRPLWPYEAYFSFTCHKFLPEDVDRVLCIDAGDVLFAGEIDEFYFDDFDGKVLNVSLKYAKEDWTCYTSKDLSIPSHLNMICGGLFNSGVFMVNVEKFRQEDISILKLIEISKMFPEYLENNNRNRTFTDEALWSIVYIDKIKYFKYPEIKDLGYKPYNFTLSIYMNRNDVIELDYEPKIIHYISLGMPKPWNLIYKLIEKNAIKAEGNMLLSDILEIATNTQNFVFQHYKYGEMNLMMIEPGMIPFFEYWFNVNELVKKDFEKIFK